MSMITDHNPTRIPKELGSGSTHSTTAPPCRAAVFLGAAALALIGGCQQPTHLDQKQQAQKNWGQVRSLVRYQLATEQYESGQLDDALESISQAIELDHENPGFHLLMAKCYLERGELASAEQATDIAAGGGVNADLCYTRGLIAERRERYDEALEQYEQAAYLDPNNSEYLVAAIETMVALDRADDARLLLDTHIDDFDRDGRLALLRADLCILLGDFDQAAADLAEAGSIGQGDSSVHEEQYGLVLIRAGRYSEALSVLRPLVETDPPSFTGGPANKNTSPAVIRAVATCYNRLGAPKAARTLLEEYLDANPEDARAWWVSAESSIELEDWSAALRAALRGEKLAPELPHWRLIRAFCAWRQDNPAAAIERLESILSTHPDHEVARFLLNEIRNTCSDLEPDSSAIETKALNSTSQ